MALPADGSSTASAAVTSLFGFLLQIGSLAGLALTFSLLSWRLPVIAAQVSAFALMVWARRTSALFATTAMAGTAMRITMEERLLRQRYPEYAAYAAKTARVVPFLI